MPQREFSSYAMIPKDEALYDFAVRSLTGNYPHMGVQDQNN